MYIKLPNTYPYSLGSLKLDFPNVSFPKVPSKETLSEFGIYPVRIKAKPVFDSTTHTAVETLPVQADNEWVQNWELRPLNEDQIKDLVVKIKDQIAERRYMEEIKGLKYSFPYTPFSEEGHPLDSQLVEIAIKTDRESQSLITGAALSAMLDDTYVCNWKAEGAFVQLSAEQILDIAKEIRKHVQNCFNREAVLLEELKNGTFVLSMLESDWGG
jgi:hypothetical protein